MLDPNDLLGVVREDLAFIAEAFTADIDMPSMRRASPTLRRLLVDNELGRAWKAAGYEKQPLIEAMELCPTPHGMSSAFRSCSQIERGGMIFGAMGMMIGPAVDFDAMESSLRDAVTNPVMLRLPAFMAAPCLEFDGKLISRHRVVKYVSNKLGGSHHDVSRKNDDEDRLFASMDRLSRDAKHMIMDLPMPYVELLAIGQAIAESKDVQRLWKL